MQEMKKEALESLRGRWLLAICVTLCSEILSAIGINYNALSVNHFLFGKLTNFLNNLFHIHLSFSITLVDMDFLSILFSPIIIASTFVLLSLVRSEKNITFFSLFQLCTSAKKFFQAIGLFLLVHIFTWLWSLLFIIPGIIKSYSYAQTYFIWKDNPDISFLEAITASRKLMNGHKLELFLLQVSFIGWAILSILTIGIGFIWLIPYYQTTMAVFYERLVRDEHLLLG